MADATRIQKTEVDFTVKDVDETIQQITVSEKEARNLMHSLASALGYQATPAQ